MAMRMIMGIGMVALHCILLGVIQRMMKRVTPSMMDLCALGNLKAVNLEELCVVLYAGQGVLREM